MRRRGYHVRRHQRTNWRGNTFAAGQGGLVVLQKPRLAPQAQVQRQRQGLVLDEAAIAKVKKPRVGVQLGEMIMELSVNRMYEEDEQRVKTEPLSDLWDLEERVGVSKSDAKAGDEMAKFYQGLKDSEKRDYLIERLEEELENWDHDILWEDWFQTLDEEIENLKEQNKTEYWDVYALSRGKVRKGARVEIDDIWNGYPRYYYHSIQVYHLGKSGLALKYTYCDKKGVEWFYLLPHYRQRQQTSF